MFFEKYFTAYDCQPIVQIGDWQSFSYIFKECNFSKTNHSIEPYFFQKEIFQAKPIKKKSKCDLQSYTSVLMLHLISKISHQYAQGKYEIYFLCILMKSWNILVNTFLIMLFINQQFLNLVYYLA